MLRPKASVVFCKVLERVCRSLIHMGRTGCTTEVLVARMVFIIYAERAYLSFVITAEDPHNNWRP